MTSNCDDDDKSRLGGSSLKSSSSTIGSSFSSSSSSSLWCIRKCNCGGDNVMGYRTDGGVMVVGVVGVVVGRNNMG